MTITDFDDVAVELALPDGPLSLGEEQDPFVSKVGGKPTLLFPSKILKDDSSRSLACSRCGNSKYLILQLDCPLEEHPEIDRVIYVFACNSRVCTEAGQVGVVTSLLQCRRAMKDKGPESEKSPSSLWSSFASGTEIASDLEQLKISDDSTTPGFYLEDMSVSFPPTALHIVDELIADTRAPSRKSSSTELDALASGETSEVWQGEVYEKMQVTGYDRAFKAFHTRVSHYPRQLARYSPGGEPLPFNADPLPTILPCDVCGKARRFELQLMPAILSKLPTNDSKYLGHIPKKERNKHPLYGDGMEWGTIMIYNCEMCCVSPTVERWEALGQVIVQIEKD